jgi:hypothetical protein
MALTISTGFRNNLAWGLGWGAILKGGVIDVYTGSKPTTANDAKNGTKLFRVTLAAAALTAETRAACRAVVSADAGTINSITIGGVTIATGINLIDSAVTCGTDAAASMALIVAAINARYSYPDFWAVASGTTVGGTTYGIGTTGEFFIIAPKNSGTVFNENNITFETTTTQITLNGGSAGTDRTGSFALGTGTGHSGNTAIPGVAMANGLTVAYPAAIGVISKEATAWQGVGLATDTAGWFRFICNPGLDDGTGALSGTQADALICRMDGTVGTSGSNLIVSSTAVTTGATQTISAFILTIPAS